MVLTQKPTHRSMEQNREPRNDHTLILSINLQQKRQKYTMGEDSLFNKWCCEKLDSYMQKNQTGPLYHTIYKNKSKLIEDLNMRPESIKLLEENIGRTLFDIVAIYIFF